MKQRLGGGPPEPDYVRLSSTAHAKTSDDIYVVIPFHLELKVADPARYRLDCVDPDKQVKLVAEMGIKTEVAATAYDDLLKSPESLCNKVLQSTKDQMQNYGLTLESIVAEKVQGPPSLAELTRKIESERAAAIQEAKEEIKKIVAGHTSAQELMKGLDTEIQVKKPLALKKRA